jgi:hypothetical protein
MIIDYQDKKGFICDQCGRYYQDTSNIRELSLSFNYGMEDDCLFASSPEYDFYEKIQEKYGERAECLRDYILQDKICICEECAGDDAYVNDFTLKVRDTRIKLLEQAIERGIIPEFASPDEEHKLYKQRWDDLLKNAKEVHDEIKDNVERGMKILYLFQRWTNIIDEAKKIATLIGKDIDEFYYIDYSKKEEDKEEDNEK